MPVPGFQTLMRPLLEILAEDGLEHPIEAVRAELADEFQLTPDELAEMLPSGRAKTFANRVGWATRYLFRSGLIEPTSAIYLRDHNARQGGARQIPRPS